MSSPAAPAVNRVQMSVTVVEREGLRYTPGGVPMLNAQVTHKSECIEAGTPRTVEMEMPVVFAGRLAETAAHFAVGIELDVSGFLAPRRRQSKTLVLHVTGYELKHQT